LSSLFGRFVNRTFTDVAWPGTSVLATRPIRFESNRPCMWVRGLVFKDCLNDKWFMSDCVVRCCTIITWPLGCDQSKFCRTIASNLKGNKFLIRPYFCFDVLRHHRHLIYVCTARICFGFLNAPFIMDDLSMFFRIYSVTWNTNARQPAGAEIWRLDLTEDLIGVQCYDFWNIFPENIALLTRKCSYLCRIYNQNIDFQENDIFFRRKLE
jgi:hypothetical protein